MALPTMGSGAEAAFVSLNAVPTGTQMLRGHGQGRGCLKCSAPGYRLVGHGAACTCGRCSSAGVSRQAEAATRGTSFIGKNHGGACACGHCSSAGASRQADAETRGASFIGKSVVAGAALAGFAVGATERRRRRQARVASKAVVENFYDVIKSTGMPEDRHKQVTEQDTVFRWLDRGPEPGSDCFEALQKYFPGALPGTAVHLLSKGILEERYGCTPANTLLGTSFCPDEINNQQFDLPTVMRNYWGKVFPMGGIGGSPFVGETGFAAFSSHVAQDGHIIVVYGPHVGVSEKGDVGEYLRSGQSGCSSACGAVIGAYKAALASQGSEIPEDIYDMQMDEIKGVFAEHAQAISESENPMASCAYQAFLMVRDRMQKIVNTKFGSGKLVLIGGIQVNMPEGSCDDYFLPLSFEVRQEGQETEDLMDTFRNVQTQQDTKFSPWAMTHAQREVFSWLTWSPPATSPIYETMHKYFPGALPSQALHERKRAILKRLGFTSENTIMATSLCPDEINHEPSDLPVIMQNHWGEVFPMGGISGAPFVGKTGFAAFSSHVPQDGNVIVLYGPHVGISEDGTVGSCLREGQSSPSTACGAVVGAYKAALAGDNGKGNSEEHYDLQMDWIKQQIAPHVESIEKSENPMASLSHQSYRMVDDKIQKCVNTNFGSGYLCLVGGIQINLPNSVEDHFWPCTFELRREGERTINLLHELKEFQ